jgi:hypothetical protein
MQTPNTLWLWLSEQAIPLAVVAAFLAFVLIVLAVSARNRRVRMNQTRSGANQETFVHSLLEYGYDAEVARTIYRYLQEEQNVHFPIEPSDLLDEDLGLDIVDLDETILDVLELTRRQYRPGLRHTPLITVEDLVRFVQASPRSADRAA